MCFLDSRVFVLGSCWLVKEGRSAAARDEALDFRELSAGVLGVVRRGLSILTLSLFGRRRSRKPRRQCGSTA